MDTRVGIRELKTHLSSYLKKVKSGKTVTVTERGQVIGCLVPAGELVRARMLELAAAGILKWSGKKPRVRAPIATVPKGRRTVSDLISEDRV